MFELGTGSRRRFLGLRVCGFVSLCLCLVREGGIGEVILPGSSIATYDFASL